MKEKQLQNLLTDLYDPETGMGIKIKSAPTHEIPLITRDSLKFIFHDKAENVQKHISCLISFLNDKSIIEDRFSSLPPEIQNPLREAKKNELYKKYGELFVENYETKNKLRSIHSTQLCGALQLISMYSVNSQIKEASNAAKDQILSLINGPQKNICTQSPTEAQNLYNNYSLDQKIETIHDIEKTIISFLSCISNIK